MRAYCDRCTAKADRDVAGAIDAKCKECGGKFSTRNRLVRYCSDKCRIDGTRRRRRESRSRYMADPEKRATWLAHMRAGAARRRRAAEGKRPAGSGSRVTRKGARAAGRPPPRPSTAKQRTCGLCGRSFVPHGRGARTHCEQCTARLDGEVARVQRIKCKECGKEFSAKNRTVRYCSSMCSTEAIRRRIREYARRRAADPKQRAILAARDRARKSGKARKKSARQK